jgi:hypothetical protein
MSAKPELETFSIIGIAPSRPRWSKLCALSDVRRVVLACPAAIWQSHENSRVMRLPPLQACDHSGKFDDKKGQRKHDCDPGPRPSREQQSCDMLVAIHDNIDKLQQQGRSIEETIAAKPTAAFDDNEASS